ncbi:hypothetical protein TNCV_476461 [Trichonephila clavipes]|nr:hypothetical protein TNCV_476461 [Trichonephila clavipes]
MTRRPPVRDPDHQATTATINNIEVVDLARQINLELGSEDVQELLNSHFQELIMDKLIEMHEQEQDIEEYLDPVQSEDQMTIGNLTGLSLTEIGLQTGLHSFNKTRNKKIISLLRGNYMGERNI